MIAHTPLDFIVLSYPRSGSTWVANWLTTDRSLCLHDPFGLGMPDTWPRDGRTRGIACTGSYLFGDWLAQHDCPIAIIERDRAACDASLERIGYAPGIPAAKLDAIDGYRIGFDHLWDEDKAEALWAHLLPRAPFDAIRYRQLRMMQVQPHMGQLHHDIDTMTALAGRITLRAA